MFVPALQLQLLNEWQHDFPLVRQPYDQIGAACATSGEFVRDIYARLLRTGFISRIGGAWGAGAGGAAMLCAFAVPPDRLADVAARVSAHPGVNHNYEREHDFNLWFVITARNAAQLEQGVRTLEAQTGFAALRLSMRRAYHIDLGFDLERGQRMAARSEVKRPALPVDGADEPLAALVEDGLPLVDRPYDVWAAALGRTAASVLATLQGWLDSGTLRRFGVIVRHHEIGYAANAMTVFDVADAEVDAAGDRLSAQHGVTLCYCRERDPCWPYNLYCMVHGRSRDEVFDILDNAIAGSGLRHRPRAVLFSRRRFKQQGARYFRALPESAEADHA